MMNDSYLSNNSCTQPLRQQLFNFQVSLLNQTRGRQLIKNKKNRSNNKNNNKNNVYNPNNIQTQYQLWKPKISSKRLFQQTHFIISLDKRRKRALTGVDQVNVQKAEVSKPFSSRNTSSRGKVQRQNFQKKHMKHLYKSMFAREQQTIFNLPQHPEPKQRKVKTPHFNFNLHHMLDKRKTFDSRQVRIQGSSKPFYNFFASDKFQIKNSILSIEKIFRKENKSSISHRRTNSNTINRPATSMQNYPTIRSHKMNNTITITHQV